MNEEIKFDPNQATFDDGLNRIRKALEKSGVFLKGIVTSKDRDVQKVMDLLQTDNIPDGFKKWQLPVYLNSPSQLFISTAAAGSKVPEHFHEDGDGIRFIVSGSIKYGDVELTAGDWMFIPKGEKYSFQVGRLGTTMCYCYSCCCVPTRLFGEDVSNPSPFVPA